MTTGSAPSNTIRGNLPNGPSGNIFWKFLALLFVLGGIAGLFFPKWQAYREQQRAAVELREAQVALEASRAQQQWQHPWLTLENNRFGMGWLRLNDLDLAQSLDEQVDDGNLFSGQLILAPRGVAWRE